MPQAAATLVTRSASIILAALSVAAIAAAQIGGPVTINIQSHPATVMAPGFSGVNVPQPRNGVEYFDPKFIAAVTPLRPGFVRFPGGTTSLAFDWNPASPTGGHINSDWMNSLIGGNPPAVTGQAASILLVSQELTQAKGGVWFSDFANFAHTLGAAANICFNSYTDTNPGSATQMALAAQNYGLHVSEWEFGNEAYLYPLIYPTFASYAAATLNPYVNSVLAASPTATVGLFPAGLYAGSFKGPTGLPCTPGVACFPGWDSGFQSYSPKYWKAMSNHIYPVTRVLNVQNTMWTLNGILAHASSDYITNYLVPLMGPNAPIFITEFNCCSSYSDKFLSYQYNGIFLAEYTARLSAVPSVKGVGVNSLYTDNIDYHGLIQSVDDFEAYLIGKYLEDNNFSTNTATDPNTQFQFYTSAPGLDMQVLNTTLNSATQVWPTTVTGGPTVNILGFDGKSIPAVYAQGYLSRTGRHHLLITNKSAATVNVTIQVNGVVVSTGMKLTYVSTPTATGSNTALAQNTVQIQKANSTNPFDLMPYSVTSVLW